jgi:hypothetical protein
MDVKSDNLCVTALVIGALSCNVGDVDLGGTDAATVPVSRISGQCTSTPAVLAHIPGIASRPLEIDGANLYVLASANGDASDETLWRVPLTGEAPQTVASDQDHVGGVAIDQTTGTVPAPVLWSTGSTGLGGGIWKNDPTSGTQSIAMDRNAPGALIVLGQRVYWGEGRSGGDGGGSIEWAPVAGGDTSTLQLLTGDEIPQTFDGDETALVWTTQSAALDNATTAQILSAPLPLPFGARQHIATGVAGIELTGEGLVYSSPKALHLVVWPSSGLSLMLQTIRTGDFVQTIEEDNTHVYYVDPSTRELMQVRIDEDGAAPRSLAVGVDSMSALQADGTCVYWIDATTQTVMMVHS